MIRFVYMAIWRRRIRTSDIVVPQWNNDPVA
jgi:hypothetical protein